jgi:hypothetical protein
VRRIRHHHERLQVRARGGLVRPDCCAGDDRQHRIGRGHPQSHVEVGGQGAAPHRRAGQAGIERDDRVNRRHVRPVGDEPRRQESDRHDDGSVEHARPRQPSDRHVDGSSKTKHPGKRPTGTTTGPSTTAGPGNGPTSTPAGTTTTIAANPASPVYTGPSPLACLQAAGLNQARAAVEPQVWEGNAGSSSLQDSNSIVFLSGPYKDAVVATQYAQSLLVVELAASGGRWVASASIRSHLNAAVDAAAACMAGSGSS